MAGDYHILASIYDEIAMGTFAQSMTPRLVNYALRNDWTGRRILVLGVGGGHGVDWLAEHNYIVTGIDKSPEMLQRATDYLKRMGTSYTPIEQDIRELDGEGNMDMVLALDVINEMDGIREIETVFKNAHKTLRDGKLFVFDFYTIEGLATRLVADGDSIAYDRDNLTIVTQDNYDYERQVHTRRYIIFREQGDGWQRQRRLS